MALVILGIAVGGFLGGMARYGFSRLFDGVPAGTFAANIVGAAGIGIAVGLYRAAELGDVYSALVITGLAGGLSTWSTLAKELGLMLQRKEYKRAGLYSFFTITIGLMVFHYGLRVGTLLVSNSL
ncbi:hypothetical protein CPHO_02705 [Corynebacterium phocae]|uniref:Fluoride-specific ion channel FluC n=1 Tax=Corynebacterium phocae TaxID=161895 RepID=A0A1L7D6F8_9CORY|nr:hypothetical protein CPHO_02705 [Corynebacterium phocae]